MIILRPLAEVRVLIVGTGDLVDEIASNLNTYGVHHLTRLGASASQSNVNGVGNIHDPQILIQDDPKYFQSFDIVLSANQPRPFEVSLSDLRWPKDGNPDDPDLPMIVMRNATNTVKMRCQYRELLVNGTAVSKFVSLPMELLPWTDDKRALVSSTIQDEFHPSKDPTFRAYFTAALAVIGFQEANGTWPTIEDQSKVESLVQQNSNDLEAKVKDFIRTFCTRGLAAAPETTAIMARLVTLDAIKLLTGNGQPINNTNLDEVIRIEAESLKHH